MDLFDIDAQLEPLITETNKEDLEDIKDEFKKANFRSLLTKIEPLQENMKRTPSWSLFYHLFMQSAIHKSVIKNKVRRSFKGCMRSWSNRQLMTSCSIATLLI